MTSTPWARRSAPARAPLGGACSVRLAKLEQTRIASMSERDGCDGMACWLQWPWPCPQWPGCSSALLQRCSSAKAAGADASGGILARAPAALLAAAHVFWKEPLSAVPSLASPHCRHPQPDRAITVAVTDSAPSAGRCFAEQRSFTLARHPLQR